MSEILFELHTSCLNTLELTKNYFKALFKSNKIRKPKFEKVLIEITYFSSIFKKLFDLTNLKDFENVESFEENLKFVLSKIYKESTLEYSQRFFFLLDMVGFVFVSFLKNLEKDFNVEDAKKLITILKEKEKENLDFKEEFIETCEHKLKEEFFCVDCQKSICGECKGNHEKNHEIFPLEDLKIISDSLNVDYPFPKDFIQKSKKNPLFLLFDENKFIREDIKNELQ
jgi:hypothetical protein